MSGSENQPKVGARVKVLDLPRRTGFQALNHHIGTVRVAGDLFSSVMFGYSSLIEIPNWILFSVEEQKHFRKQASAAG